MQRREISSQPRARRRRRRLLFVLIALGLGVVLAAIAVEVAFRLFWPLPPAFAMFDQAGMFIETPDGGFGIAPGFRGVHRVNDGAGTLIRANSLGMRGTEVGAKRAGERRVLVLGDSLVFGYGVGPDDTLPVALSRELDARGYPAIVGNGGVPGFGSVQTVKRMAFIDPQFASDAFVFCGYLGNDAYDDLQVESAICNGLRFQGHMARVARESLRFRLASRSRAALWFETWILNNKPEWSPVLLVAPSNEEAASMMGLPGQYPGFKRTVGGVFLDVADENTKWAEGAPPVIPRILGKLRDSLRRAQKIAGDRPLVFVVLPTFALVNEDWRQAQLTRLKFDPAEFPRGTAQRRWLAVAAELGIPAVDVTAALGAAPDPRGVWVDNGGHFNREGAEIAAREVAAALVPLLK